MQKHKVKKSKKEEMHAFKSLKDGEKKDSNTDLRKDDIDWFPESLQESRGNDMKTFSPVHSCLALLLEFNNLASC